MTDKAIRQGVLERSQGRCEACGKPISGDWECHHRLLRSQGGKDELSNLLALHMDCHAKAHGQRKDWGEPRGYIIRGKLNDPAEVPVLLWGAVRVHLDDEGYYAPIEESA